MHACRQRTLSKATSWLATAPRMCQASPQIPIGNISKFLISAYTASCPLQFRTTRCARLQWWQHGGTRTRASPTTAGVAAPDNSAGLVRGQLAASMPEPTLLPDAHMHHTPPVVCLAEPRCQPLQPLQNASRRAARTLQRPFVYCHSGPQSNIPTSTRAQQQNNARVRIEGCWPCRVQTAPATGPRR